MYASPARTTEIGGSTAPRFSASQILIQRERVERAGRNSTSNCSARFGSPRPGNRRERALAHARGARPGRPLVEHGEPQAAGAAPQQRRAAACTRGLAERALGLHARVGSVDGVVMHASRVAERRTRVATGCPPTVVRNATSGIRLTECP